MPTQSPRCHGQLAAGFRPVDRAAPLPRPRRGCKVQRHGIGHDACASAAGPASFPSAARPAAEADTGRALVARRDGKGLEASYLVRGGTLLRPWWPVRRAGGYRGAMGEILTLTLQPRGPAAAFLLSDEQVAAVGGERRAFPVRVSINGVTLPL